MYLINGLGEIEEFAIYKAFTVELSPDSFDYGKYNLKQWCFDRLDCKRDIDDVENNALTPCAMAYGFQMV